MSSTSILSRPTGPSEVLTMLATASAAVTLAMRTSWPVSRVPLMNWGDEGSIQGGESCRTVTPCLDSMGYLPGQCLPDWEPTLLRSV